MSNKLTGTLIVLLGLFYANYFAFNRVDYDINQELWISMQTLFLLVLGVLISEKKQ